MSMPQSPLDRPIYGATFGEAFSRYWTKGFTFSGRASRSEFWFMYLVGAVAGVVLYLLDSAVRVLGDPVLELFLLSGAVVVGVVGLVPGLALSVRRLHDVNLSGWWLLLSFVPFGALALLVMFVQDPRPEAVRFDGGTSHVPVPPIPLPPPYALAPRTASAQPVVLPPPAAAPRATTPKAAQPPASGRMAARWTLAAVGALTLVAVVVAVGVSSIPRSSADAAPTGTALAQQATPTTNPYSLAPDAREAALRAQVESAGWQQYSDGLYFKWETGKSACRAGWTGGCATVQIESVSAVRCDAGMVMVSLLRNGSPVGNSSGNFYGLAQGEPMEVGIPFDPSLRGDTVRLDRILCS